MNDHKLKVGEWIEVRSKEEILRTLDKDGRLEGMPFMPEMLSFCGKRFLVHKRAHKTCDTVFPVRSRRIANAIHLETRCSGQAHGGCQAGCLLFWKEAWLKPAPGVQADAAAPGSTSATGQGSSVTDNHCTEADVQRATRDGAEADGDNPTYACQATKLPYYSQDLSPYDFRQYIEDFSSGNVSLGKWLRGLIYMTYENLTNLGIGWGPALRWFYERFQKLWGGLPYPRRPGKIPMNERTPTGELNLQEGEWVRVKSYEAILATCNIDNKNRGMGFDGEMLPYCGGTYRVHKRVNHIINEKTGKMMNMKNPCIILENVYCQGRYSHCRMFCAREIFSYWREIWLERVGPTDANQPKVSGS